MSIRALAISLLSLVAHSTYPQVRLFDDGELVAHGVKAGSVVPPLLSQRLAASALVTQDEAYYSPAANAEARRLRQRQGAAPSQTIGPLLHSIRDQEAPYNWQCPRWTYEDGSQSEERCLSGCVATCIEQVMAYYSYPEALQDTLHGWETEHYVLNDMLPGTRFDWDNYLDDYRAGYTQSQGEAIAAVSLAAGMAVHMSYGLHSSGASLWRAETPLQQAFGYGLARLYDRALYSPRRWHALVENELRQGRPVAYAAHTMALNGHAFNIDGVDARGFYHVNWGYNGSYDGWYDLDWLDPWEPTDHPADGIVLGFFSNHTLLVMHPSADAKPLETDTFSYDSLGIRLHGIHMLRQADTKGYIPADFDFENESLDTVTYTYEVLSYLPTDTAVFMQADYVGLATLTLLPSQRRKQRTYLQFDTEGERILGISHDDATIPYSQPVSIVAGTRSQLQWGEAQMVQKQYEVTFTIPVRNNAATGIAGDLITHCLFADGREDDTRHYDVLSLAAGSDTTLTVRFRTLQPATHYTYLLRCPWDVQARVEFTTPSGAGIMGNEEWGGMKNEEWDLSGRPATGRSNVIIHNNRKYLNDTGNTHR